METTNILNMENKEYRYRLLLRSLLSPVGAPDTRKKCSPQELIKHVKEVFDIQDEVHDRISDEEQHDKSITLHISKVGAKLLRIPDHLSHVDPYCIVSLVNRIDQSHSSKFYPKEKVKGLPSTELSKSRSFPRVFDNEQNIAPSLRHNNSFEGLTNSKSKKVAFSHVEVRRTCSYSQTMDPVWSEHFEIGVSNAKTEEIQVYIWDSKKKNTSTTSKSEKSSGVKGFLKMVKNSFDHNDPLEDMIGFFSVPIKDIPTAGCEQWFPLYTKRKGGSPICGKLHMKLNLMVKNSNQGCEFESVESDQCTLEDFYEILKLIHIKSARRMKDENAEYYNGKLDSVNKVVVRQFCVQNRLSEITQNVINCAILLEWNKSLSAERCQLKMHPNFMLEFIEKLLDDNKTEAGWEMVDHFYKSVDDLFSISEFELESFDQGASWFVEDYLSTKESIELSFFPINSSQKLELKSKLRILESIMELDLSSKETLYRKAVLYQLTSKTKRDVYVKVDQLLQSSEVEKRDGELSLAKNFASTVNKCIKICEETQNNCDVFSRLFFNYSAVLASSIDEKIAHLAQDVIKKIDNYLTRYQHDDVNVKEGSSISLSLYFAVKNLYKVLLNICQSSTRSQQTVFDLHPKFNEELQLKNYSKWFLSQFQFWLQTFRNECLNRTERAVELDSTPSQVVEDVQISASCVDAISCFTQVCTEWKKIELEDTDLKIVAVTKLTDAICDGARHYVKHLLNSAQKFYENGSDCIKTQNCLIINNMEHVRRFLPTIPNILEWEPIIDELSQGDEEHQLKVQALKTLSRLIKCAEKDIREHLDSMLSRIAAYLNLDINVCLQKWTDTIDQTRDIDSLLKGLDVKLCNLHSYLKDSVFTPLLMELWKVILQSLEQLVVTGEPPEYAESLLENLEQVRDYFLQLGLREKEITNNYVYQSLSQKLRYNAKPTIDLQLDYFKDLTNAMSTPIDYQGHLCVKFGFEEESMGTFTILTYVLRAVHLPGLDHSGSSDPYVSLELLPKPLFPTINKQKTRIVKATLNPVFNELFSIPNVSSESFKTAGAVLRLCVKDFDKIGSNDFAGEILLNLDQASDMSKVTSVDFLPALMLPLKRPVETDGPFQVLKDRKKWDKEAKLFVKRRMKAISNQRERTDKSPSRKITDFFNH